MIRKKFAIEMLIIPTLLCASLAWGQASVNENLETATLYVDANKGNDNNPGTAQKPLRTIGAAATKATTNNAADIGTKVIINSGTYREAVTLTAGANGTTLPITFQAATTGKAIMSGADISTGWKVYSGNSNIYTNTWPNKWGLCLLDSDPSTPEPDIVRRREMVVVNGAVLSQVLSLSAVKQPSTFYVDENKGTIYVWPPSGTNMTSATVELPSRDTLFTIRGNSNIVLRGLTFQYGNACRGQAAVSVKASASNILLDTDFFYWNNSAGLFLNTTTSTTVQNSISNHNGTDGMKGFTSKYDLWQNNQARYNGWRGAQGVYYSQGTGGMHFGLAHNQTIKNVDSSFNQTFGFHWDTDNQNDTADSLIVSQNQLPGGFMEKSEGPLTITNSYFCNGAPFAGPNNFGFELRNSTNAIFSGNTFLNNQGELLVIGQPGGIKVSNWETGQSYNLITSSTSLTNSIISGGTGQQLFLDGSLGGSDWAAFQSTLVSDYNTWWNGTATKVFTVPVPALWSKTDFAGWQAATGKDAHSTWASPGNSGACKVTPDTPDYWFIMDEFTYYPTITRGSSATFTLYSIPVGNFTGTVTVSSDGMQNIPGATGTWSSTSIKPSATSTFTVKTASSTPAGTYPVTLIATNGTMTRTATVSITVQ